MSIDELLQDMADHESMPDGDSFLLRGMADQASNLAQSLSHLHEAAVAEGVIGRGDPLGVYFDEVSDHLISLSYVLTGIDRSQLSIAGTDAEAHVRLAQMMAKIDEGRSG